MAKNSSRSMNADLATGALEGSYKLLVRNRGGVVESHASEMREKLDDVWYGFHEAPSFNVPGLCKTVGSQYPMPQRPIDSTKW